MRILTISASPYLLTKHGRLHSDIIKQLYKKHTLYSAVWHHDLKWFAPDDKGHFFYEENGKRICQLLPFMHQPSTVASPQLYEIFQRVKPDLILSLGDYNEVDSIFALKTLNPNKFKWVHILTLNAGPIKETYNDIFKCMDYVIHTNSKSKKLVDEISPVINKVCYVGVDETVFNYKNKINDDFRVINSAKNSQTTGISSLIYSSQYLKDISIYCHTNLYDTGDYDLNILKDRYDKNDIIKFPENYVGLNDGVSDKELNRLYNDSDVFIDVSVRSSTAISLIESMASGCIPVATRVGALKEIIEKLPTEYQFFVDVVPYIGSLEEEYVIASPQSIASILKIIYNIKKEDKGNFIKIKKNISDIAKKLKRKYLLEQVDEAIGIVQKENSLIVESF